MKHPAAKKPRGDAVLKTLGDALQEELFQQLRVTSQVKTLAWLQEQHGIKSSPAALTKFFDWYPRQGWLKQSASIASQIGSAIKEVPALKEQAAAASEVAQVSFEILAAQNRDSGFFMALQRERREERRLQLDREKHEWQKKSDVEKALDALHAEIKSDSEALDLWAKLSTRLAQLAEARA